MQIVAEITRAIRRVHENRALCKIIAPLHAVLQKIRQRSQALDPYLQRRARHHRQLQTQDRDQREFRAQIAAGIGAARQSIGIAADQLEQRKLALRLDLQPAPVPGVIQPQVALDQAAWQRPPSCQLRRRRNFCTTLRFDQGSKRPSR